MKGKREPTNNVYQCEDCGNLQMMMPHEIARRTKTRCNACGSTWFERVDGDTKE